MNNRLLRLSLIALAAPALAWAQTPPTLDKIKQSGTMTLAYREASIPFSYLDDKAKPTGFGFEICERSPTGSRPRPAGPTCRSSTRP
jgi:glutamate/aspartate transport system substrate-binding protein